MELCWIRGFGVLKSFVETTSLGYFVGIMDGKGLGADIWVHCFFRTHVYRSSTSMQGGDRERNANDSLLPFDIV